MTFEISFPQMDHVSLSAVKIKVFMDHIMLLSGEIKSICAQKSKGINLLSAVF